MTIISADATALLARFYDNAGTDVAGAVSRIIQAAAPNAVYAVGGTVRDLLLEREVLDFDLSAEGDAREIAMAAAPATRWTAHDRFNTASAVIAGRRVDLAMTRAETYLRPAALPDVQASDIDADLKRRDFSINAMALRLSDEPALLDPCGGIPDLQAATIRVLHRRSFIDDPTRIYRAYRYAARLGFELEPATTELAREGLVHVAALTGARLRRELELLLLDEPSGAGLRRAHAAGALSAAHPTLGWTAQANRALGTAGARSRLPFGFAMLSAGADRDQAAEVIDRLRLRHDEAAAVEALPALREAASILRRPNAKPSGVVQVLDRYPEGAVAALGATVGDPVASGVVGTYLSTWRHERTLLRGDDLQALGVPVGPQIRKGLQLIRAARLDGWATDEGDERALALRFAKSIRDSAATAADTAGVDIELHIHDN